MSERRLCLRVSRCLKDHLDAVDQCLGEISSALQYQNNRDVGCFFEYFKDRGLFRGSPSKGDDSWCKDE